MSLNNISFGGILGPLVESLQRKPRQLGRLAGQDVVIPDKEGLAVIIAVDSEDDIHLLITPAQTDDGRFSRLDLKGLKVENHEWSVSGHPAQTYLDISCSTGALPAFRRPFLRFAEDVLFEISKTKDAPSDAVYRTGMKWKRFWSADDLNEVTSEWLHGIAGELSFLIHLIEEFGPSTVFKWYGPAGKDHDFQSGTDVAVEVKASTAMPRKINCNIRQLDSTIFKKLFVVCYHIVSSEKGVALPKLVERIESLISDNEEILDSFQEKLAAAGYSRQSEQAYEQHPLNVSAPVAFRVDESFPKIAESSFIISPDHRISNIRYTLQLTGLPELALNDIKKDLRPLADRS